MAYVPLNPQVFLAAYSGALAGMAAGDRVPLGGVSTDPGPVNVANVTLAFAEEFDTIWTAAPADSYQVQAIEAICGAAFEITGQNANAAPFSTPATWLKLVQALIAYVKAGSAALAAQGIVPPPATTGIMTTFVFRPGGVAEGNVFTTWASLIAATQQEQGPKIIEFDSSLAACVIPAGAYAINPAGDPSVIEWVGAQGFTTTVTVSAGVSFTGTFPTRFRRLTLNWSGIAACINVTVSTGIAFVFNEGASVVGVAGATAPFIQAGAGGFVQVSLFDTALLNVGGGGTAPVAAVGAGALTNVEAYDFSTVSANSVASSGGGTVGLFQADSASVALNQSGVAGGIAVSAVNTFTGNYLIVDPTVVSPKGNVFTTLAEAVAYVANAVPALAGPKTYEFRGNQTIAAGAYALSPDGSPVEFVGSNGGATSATNTQLTIATGVTFTGTPPTLFRRMTVLWQGTGAAASAITYTGTGLNFELRENAVWRQSGAGATVPFLTVSGGGVATVTLRDTSQWASDASQNALVTGAGSSLTINAYDSSALPINSASAAAGGTLAINQADNANVAALAGTAAGLVVAFSSTANKVFTFRPGAASAGGANVFSSWPTLVAAVNNANVSGPRVIVFDDSIAAITIPAGAYDFSLAGTRWDVTFRGKPTTTGGSQTTVTIADGVTILGVVELDDVFVISQTTATAVMTPPVAVPLLFRMRNGATIQQTGAGTFLRAQAGATVTVLMSDITAIARTAGSVFDANGAAATFNLDLLDSATVFASTLSQAAAGAMSVTALSPFVTLNLTQAALVTNPMVWGGGTLTNAGPGTSGIPGFRNAAVTNNALTDASSTTAPAPAAQTTPAALTDVLAAIVTPAGGVGKFRVKASLEMAATAADTLICTVTTRTRTAVLVPANATATGINCFFATANGPITYGAGVLTNSTKVTKSLLVPAAPLSWEFVWDGIIAQGGAQAGFPTASVANANNVAVAITVQDALHNVTGFAGGALTGSLSVEEILFG